MRNRSGNVERRIPATVGGVGDDAVELLGEGLTRRGSLRWVLLEQAHDEAVERAWHVWVHGRRGHWDRVRDRSHQCKFVFARREGRPARQHLVKHIAEAVQLRLGRELEALRAGVELLRQVALALLRRKVRESSEDGALGSNGEVRAAASDAHVEEYRLTIWTHHKVVGLDVAVKDAVAVKLVERQRSLDEDVADPAERRRELLLPLVQALAFHEVHDEEGMTIARRPAVEGVHADDVRMTQRQENRDLAPEAIFMVLALGGAEVGHLQLRHLQRVVGVLAANAVERPKASRADARDDPAGRVGSADDFIEADPRPGGEVVVWRWLGVAHGYLYTSGCEIQSNVSTPALFIEGDCVPLSGKLLLGSIKDHHHLLLLTRRQPTLQVGVEGHDVHV